MWNKSALPVLLVVLSACTGVPARLGDGSPSLKTAETALASGAPELAYRICGTLVDNGDTSVKTMVCKANALTALGRSAEAASSFAIALQSQPQNPDALIGVGRLRLTTDPGGAEQLFMRALAVQPHDSVALNNLGIARDLQGRHRDAQSAYAEALAANPDSHAPQVNLALSMAMSGRAGEASRMLRPLAISATSTARERHDYAAVLTMAGRPDEATQYLSPELTTAQAQEAVQGYRSRPGADVAPALPSTLAPKLPINLPTAIRLSRTEPSARPLALAAEPAPLAVAVPPSDLPSGAAPIKLTPVAALTVQPGTPAIPRVVLPTPTAPAPDAPAPDAPAPDAPAPAAPALPIRLAPLLDVTAPRAPVP